MGFLEWVRSGGFGERKAVTISNYAPPVQYGYAGRTNIGPALLAGTLIHGPGATQTLRDAQGQGRADNSAVYACLQALTRAYIEPPLRVFTGEGDDRAIVDNHPLAMLLKRPNPYMPGKNFFRYMQWCKQVHGNAYWQKVRAGDANSGNVVQLWPISPTRIAPLTTKGSNEFISFYRHWLTANTYEDIPVGNVVHFRMGIDDDDHRVGCSPLARLLREISSDNEATQFADSLLRNKGMPGLVVVPPKDAQMDEAGALAVKARIEAAYSGDNIGRVGVVSPGADMKMLGFDPKSMDLSTLHRIPEERISAVLGVPAVLAGLGAGLENATYSNVRELREFFTESTLVPLWAEDAETITHQLLLDFSGNADEYLQFDLDDVRALQQDENDLYGRLSVAVTAGWLLPSDARKETGYEDNAALDMPAPAPTPMVPPGKGLRAVKSIDVGDFPALLAAARADAEARTRQAVGRELGSLARRVKGRVGAG